MKLTSLALPFAALALAAPAVHAETPSASKEARIAFANSGGIRDWHAADRDTLYIQDRHRNWYKAELMGPSLDLKFAWAIGFDTGPTNTLDKFSSVVVRGHKYPLRSLVRVHAVPPHKRNKRDQA